MINPDLYRSAFTDDFSGRIEITTTPQVFPHLKEAALLDVGEPLLIIPELDPVVPELQDYTILAIGAISRHLNVNDIDPKPFGKRLMQLDSFFAEKLGRLPPGIAIVRHGEMATIGRDSMPQLDLDPEVSGLHAYMSVEDSGITIADVGSLFGTKLTLSRKDSESGVPLLEPKKIPTKMRDELFSAFSKLCVDGQLEINSPGIKIKGSYTSHIDSPFHCMELVIRKADKYTRVKPAEDFRFTKVFLDPLEEGSLVRNISYGTERVDGISRASTSSQLTTEQAKELMHLALSDQ